MTVRAGLQGAAPWMAEVLRRQQIGAASRGHPYVRATGSLDPLPEPGGRDGRSGFWSQPWRGSKRRAGRG